MYVCDYDSCLLTKLDALNLSIFQLIQPVLKTYVVVLTSMQIQYQQHKMYDQDFTMEKLKSLAINLHSSKVLKPAIIK